MRLTAKLNKLKLSEVIIWLNNGPNSEYIKGDQKWLIIQKSNNQKIKYTTML